MVFSMRIKYKILIKNIVVLILNTFNNSIYNTNSFQEIVKILPSTAYVSVLVNVHV